VSEWLLAGILAFVVLDWFEHSLLVQDTRARLIRAIRIWKESRNGNDV